MLIEPMIARLEAARDLEETLQTGLRDFVALQGAELGDVQLVGHDGALVIVAGRGLTPEFLDAFQRVSVDSPSACGRAARDGRPHFIPDVSRDPDYAPYHALAAAMPFRAVLSCPLLTSGRAVVGMVSALSAQHFRPTPLEFQTAAAYGTHLADAIVRHLPCHDLPAWAEARAERVREAAGVQS